MLSAVYSWLTTFLQALPAEQTAGLSLFVIVLLLPTLRRTYFAAANDESVTLEQRRYTFFDALRGLAIILIIFGHVIYIYLQQYSHNQYPFNDFYATSIINNLFRFLLPLFFISSGILLNPSDVMKGGVFDFYRRKLLRLFVPYTLMTALVTVYLALIGASDFDSFFYLLFTGTAMIPYYFIYVLFQFYIIYPFIVRFRHSRKFLFASFLISFLFFLLPNTWPIGGVYHLGPFLFFFAYGMYYRYDFLALASGKSRESARSLSPWFTLLILYFFSIVIFPGIYDNASFFFALAVFNILAICYHSAMASSSGKLRFILSFVKSLSPIGARSLWIFLTHFPIAYLSFLLFTEKIHTNYYLGFWLASALAVIVSVITAFIIDWLYKQMMVKLFPIYYPKI